MNVENILKFVKDDWIGGIRLGERPLISKNNAEIMEQQYCPFKILFPIQLVGSAE